MKKLVLGLAVLPFLAGMSLAGQPLTDQQMDKVAAGFDFTETDINNVGALTVEINEAAPTTSPCATAGTCFIDITGTVYPSGVHSFQLFAAFGPGF